jgi:hypothetical protein
MTIFAPSATKTSAVRKPMPLVAPVMTATLPSSRPISLSFLRSSHFCLDQYPRLAEATQAVLAFQDRGPNPKIGFAASGRAISAMLGPILDSLTG